MSPSGRRRRFPLLSPGGLLLRAAGLAALFLAVHLAGLREYTSVISGTSPTGRPPDGLTVVLGVTYGSLYLLFVLLVPILVIAASILLALLLLRRKAPPA